MTILIADPRVTGIAVRDNKELLVDLASYGIGYSRLGPARHPRGRLVRRGVAERLVAADASLPAGIGLLVVEGFRTGPAQQEIITRYRRQVATADPSLGAEALGRLVSRYVAPLDVAPHLAGAAVDVTLATRDGVQLDLGTQVDATPEESDNACAFDAPSISDQARSNRSLLATALGRAGMVNYPTEWWHWSYGDRYWAHVTGAAAACYGSLADETTAEPAGSPR